MQKHILALIVLNCNFYIIKQSIAILTVVGYEHILTVVGYEHILTVVGYEHILTVVGYEHILTVVGYEHIDTYMYVPYFLINSHGY